MTPFTVASASTQILRSAVPDKFTNTGPLRQIDFHTNECFITEWLEA